MFPGLEGSKDKNGGMAYDFILERAKGNTPKKTPSKERPLSQELIEKKLKDAEARRLVSRSDSKKAHSEG